MATAATGKPGGAAKKGDRSMGRRMPLNAFTFCDMQPRLMLPVSILAHTDGAIARHPQKRKSPDWPGSFLATTWVQSP
jgi:hypothetical protein